MVCRRGGRLTEEDQVTCNGQILKVTNSFRYLGVTIQVTVRAFVIHIKERLVAAVHTINEIRCQTDMSLVSAMKLFDAKIWPTCTYGLEIMWEYLTPTQLRNVELLKARFLKRTLGLSKYTPSRLVYVLSRETFFIEDLRTRLLLCYTDSYNEVFGERTRKREEIWAEFYTADG